MHSLLQSELVTVKHKLSLHFKRKKLNKGGLVENMEGMIDLYIKRQSEDLMQNFHHPALSPELKSPVFVSYSQRDHRKLYTLNEAHQSLGVEKKRNIQVSL